jgi:hypothetical protein
MLLAMSNGNDTENNNRSSREPATSHFKHLGFEHYCGPDERACVGYSTYSVPLELLCLEVLAADLPCTTRR